MTEPKWVGLARADVGIAEIRGANDNQKIIGYRKDARCSWVKGSEEAVPWCAIAVNAWLERCGIKGTASPAAKSFCEHRQFVPIPGPALGAIVVIERDPPHPSYGHVAFCVGADKEWVYLLGGNQSDAVNVRRFSRKRVRGYYWPGSQPLPVCKDFRCDVAAVEGGKVA